MQNQSRSWPEAIAPLLGEKGYRTPMCMLLGEKGCRTPMCMLVAQHRDNYLAAFVNPEHGKRLSQKQLQPPHPLSI